MKTLRREAPIAVRRQLAEEVGFGCPIEGWGSPYLMWHHFDPPWRVREHHDPVGMRQMIDHLMKLSFGHEAHLTCHSAHNGWRKRWEAEGPSDGAAVDRTQKSPAGAGLSLKRLKGFEPSTFCMASRRSSQLSYIRDDDRL